MEEARKKLRVCLICVVTIAVTLGAAYYFYEMNEGYRVNEGTLITITTGIAGLVGGL